MAEQQPESAPAIQAFLQWKSKTGVCKTGCGGSDNIIGSDYISQAVLQEYLTTERIKMLLQDLFENKTKSPPHAERVRSKYLRPFAILLAIGYGSMIHHLVEHRELQDQSLPFTTEPKDFPKTSTENLFETFRKEQWQFCAVPLEYDMRDDLADDYILPITAKEEISDGGSAILYKITVDEAYNKLKPADGAHTAARRRTTNTFALKTYRTPEAKKYFENERNAFLQLRYGDRPPKNIIEYYGSFIRRGTYNIILEYADRGTLDDYMKDTAEPKTVNEIRSFWKNFLASMRGLVQIHGTHEPAFDGPKILLGWHHDIHPSNILVVSRGQDSPYDCDFKIADLGLAHFKRYISLLNNATDNDRYGTSTYGAPEIFRSRDLEKCHLLVLQSADIWSMGCVYSEVATWVTAGSHKLCEYRRRRQKEIGKRLGVASSEEDRFHHVSEVLETVNGIHAEIEHNSRRCDLITPCVIEKLVKAMVRPYPQSRGAAQFLLETSRQILKDAEEKRKDAMPSGPAPHPDHTNSDSRIDVRGPRLPPSLPPDHRFASEQQPIIETATSLRRPSTTHGQPNNHNWPQRSVPKPNEEGPRRQSQEGRMDDDPEAQRVEPRTWILPHAPNCHPDSPIAGATKPEPKSQYPTMSVCEGLSIIKDKKWRFAKYPGEDIFHTSDDILKKRDHVFLIDNGESMRPHRKKVEEAVELLATLTQPYDPDGLDLYFSTESTKLRPKTPEKFLKYLRDRPAHGRPDFRQRFATIIEDYRSRFGQPNHSWARLRHPKSTPSKGPLPLSLYVLTDGVWDPKCTLITEVKNLVASLQAHNYRNKYVGIQFIRFGNDREGKKRLKTLDARLGLPL
ncbi:MAG: hypothetical protein Q9198_002778 [Flavoplaca austrocitrina]